MIDPLAIQRAWSGEFPYPLLVRQQGDSRSLSVGRSAAQEAIATNQKCPDAPGQFHVRCWSISHARNHLRGAGFLPVAWPCNLRVKRLASAFRRLQLGGDAIDRKQAQHMPNRNAGLS